MRPVDLRGRRANRPAVTVTIDTMTFSRLHRPCVGGLSPGSYQGPTKQHRSRIALAKFYGESETEMELGQHFGHTPLAVTETENGFVVGADVLVGKVEHVEAVARNVRIAVAE